MIGTIGFSFEQQQPNLLAIIFLQLGNEETKEQKAKALHDETNNFAKHDIAVHFDFFRSSFFVAEM